MPNNDLYALVWKIVATLFLAIIVTIAMSTGYNEYRRTELIERMAEKGMSPAGIACAVENYSSATVCAMLAAKTDK